jgi:hypothetical protein
MVNPLNDHQLLADAENQSQTSFRKDTEKRGSIGPAQFVISSYK